MVVPHLSRHGTWASQEDMFEDKGKLTQEKAKTLYRCMLERARAKQEADEAQKKKDKQSKDHILSKAAAPNPQEGVKEQMRQVLQEDRTKGEGEGKTPDVASYRNTTSISSTWKIPRWH